MDMKDLALPHEKEYHVFLAYSSEDHAWVQSLRSSLENDYNVKCCDHERDFIPGMTTFNNVQNFIPKCMKTILVLSKGFNNSKWCHYEMEYSLCNDMNNGKQMRVIPIVIEDCEIPTYLKPLTHLDCRSDRTVWLPKLLRTILHNGDDLHKEMSLKITNMNENYRNMDLLYKESAIHHNCPCYSELPTKYIPESFTKNGLTVDWEVVTDMRLKLESKYNKKINSKFIVCSTLSSRISGAVFCICGVIFILFSYGVDLIVFRWLGILFLCLFVLSISSCIAVIYYISQKRKQEWGPILKEALPVWRANRMMCTVSYNLDITYYYYDWEPCILYSKSKLKEEMTRMGKDAENGDFDKKLEKCEEFLEDISISYIYEFNRNSLEPGNGARHCKRLICLCEYTEKRGHLRTYAKKYMR